MDYLRPSKLKIPHMNGLDPDIDLEEFKLMMRNLGGIELATAITDAKLSRTIEGASTLTVSVNDDDNRTIMRSGRLGRKVDVELDGLFFTLVGHKKTGRSGTAECNIDLVFEDREVNLLRYYTKFIYGSRDQYTRAEFILRMIDEVKEERIPWVIPELHTKFKPSDIGLNQILTDNLGHPLPTTKASQTQIAQNSPHSIAGVEKLTVKGVQADPNQIDNANKILQAGEATGARRKLLVVAIMVAIQENSIQTDPGQIINTGSGFYRINVGPFQQDSRYWPATNDPYTDAVAFFQRAIKQDQLFPNLSYNDLAQSVQLSAFPNAYGQWQSEAEAFVNAYGITGGDNADTTVPGQKIPGSAATVTTQVTTTTGLGGNFYTRGTLVQRNSQYILTKENSWQAIQRLAQEVNWRAFFVAGTFYYVSDLWLIRSKPVMAISEDTLGVDTIDYDYDEGKKVATVTVTAHLSRWSAPPGSVVIVEDMGMIDGRYIVNQVDRSLFDTVATVTLKRRQPILPEPTSLGSFAGSSGAAQAPAPPSGITGPLVRPIPAQYETGPNGIVQGDHPTAGLPGYTAIDFGGQAGCPVLAVEAGTITRFSGRDPALGPDGSQAGIYGWNIYLQGNSGTNYFYTHLLSRTCAVGDVVAVGQQIGTIVDWAKYGRPNHVHLGALPSSQGHPDINDIAAAPAIKV